MKKRLISRPLAKVFEKYGFNKDNKTSIPSALWRATKETVAAYFKGRYMADGTFQVNKQYTTSSLASTDEKFIKDAQILMANFGIKSHINVLREEGANLLPDGKGGLAEYPVKKLYRLCITSKYCNNILEENCLVFSKRGLDISPKRNCGFYKVRMETEIESIEEIGREDTYCLKVLTNDDHAWTCNGLITKNTEIFLHTKHSEYQDGIKTEIGETAVCNLASIVLPNHVDLETGEILWDKLEETTKITVRALNNVIDINFYPTLEAQNSNLRHRPIGLGNMGFADLCHMLDIIQDSDEGVALADKVAEFISLHAIMASSELAKERGKYDSYEGSLWSQGVFPIDTYNNLMRFKKSDHVDHVETLPEWPEVRQHVAEWGMRNSNTMAIAPNASIAYQMSCEQSIETNFKVIFVYENKSGQYYLINEHFVRDMKAEGIWSDSFAESLKESDGYIQYLNIPDKYKEKYKTAYDRDHFKLIEANGARQKWIDMGISFNFWVDTSSMKFLNKIYQYSNECGLKSNYYLRNKAASEVAKVTSKVSEEDEYETEGNVEENEEENAMLACSLDAMRNGGSCEMCEG
jgi:ribonucleoside-diphosphate reductase alpha chain